MDAPSMNPLHKQMLDDVFDAFTMLMHGGFVSLMHVEGGFTRYSAGAVELFGLPGEYIANGAYNWNDYLHPEDRKRYMDVMLPMLEGKTQTYDITYRMRTKTGEYALFRAVGAVLRGNDGMPSLIGGGMFNEGLAANSDPLTMLPNRGVYLERLASLMRDGTPTISLMVGIKGLGRLNRTHGYTYGNRVIQETSWVVQEVVRDHCEVFRENGARFLLLFRDLPRERVAAIYDMVRYRLQRGITINGVRTNLVANGGMISTYDTDSQPETVLSCLHYAYDESRLHGHGELVDFNGSVQMDDSQLLLVDALRRSIADGCKGFSLVYDPVFDVRTERRTGAEAVIVWEDDRFGRVPAPAFVPLLERDFLFEELSDQMLRRGLREGALVLRSRPDFLLCLNVYRIQLESDFFVEDLLEDLEAEGFPPKLLSLKLASDCRYLDHARLCAVIERLHEHGILVIIDGFGSGANSIGFLKEVPVDAVCIHSTFLDQIETSERDQAILKHLANAAASCVRHLNIAGVGTCGQRDVVRTTALTTMQGPLLSPLLSVSDLA